MTGKAISDSFSFMLYGLSFVLQNLSIEKLVEVCEALKENNVCVKLDMASVAASDRVAKVGEHCSSFFICC